MDFRDRNELHSTRSEDFAYEDEIEQELISLGVTRKELREDLRGYLTLEHSPVNIEHGTIGNIALVARKDLISKYPGSVYVVDWLNNLTVRDFKRIRPEDENILSSLMRHPGERHEWLMIAEIPALKEMGIDMQLVKDCRTKISQCRFALNKGDISLTGRHSGTGSQKMHIALRKALQDAYNQWKKDPSDARGALRTHLRKFAQVFYPAGPDSVPDGLKELIQ